jgi:hypothetical protein
MKYKISPHFLTLKITRKHSSMHGKRTQIDKNICDQWRTDAINTNKQKS